MGSGRGAGGERTRGGLIVLGHYLRVIESAPAQRIQIALMDDVRTQAAYRNLLQLGALKATQAASEVLCPYCDGVRVEPKRRGEAYSAFCPECGEIPIAAALMEVAEASLDWLLDGIAAVFQVASHSPARELVPALLWEVARINVYGKAVAVLFARTPSDSACEERLADALSDLSSNLVQLIFTSRPSVLQHLDVGGRRQVFALEDIAVIFEGRLTIDRDFVLDRLALEPPKPSAKVDVAPDGAWLEVNGRRLYLRGKQRDFALIMVEAYRKNIRRPKTEWALRQAGYEDGTSDLTHITRRKAFFQFFGYADGECWILDDRSPGAPIRTSK